MYVIQYLAHPSWNHKWVTSGRQYKTLEDARAFYDTLSPKSEYRIAEAYTVTRYKPVKNLA